MAVSLIKAMDGMDRFHAAPLSTRESLKGTSRLKAVKGIYLHNEPFIEELLAPAILHYPLS